MIYDDYEINCRCQELILMMFPPQQDGRRTLYVSMLVHNLSAVRILTAEKKQGRYIINSMFLPIYL